MRAIPRLMEVVLVKEGWVEEFQEEDPPAMGWFPCRVWHVRRREVSVLGLVLVHGEADFDKIRRTNRFVPVVDGALFAKSPSGQQARPQIGTAIIRPRTES